MTTAIKNQLLSIIDKPIVQIQAVSGGDISKAYLIQLQDQKLFCKINTSWEAYHMFKCEIAGLTEISASGKIKVPEVLGCYELNDGCCVLMEFIPTKSASNSEMENFGRQLAAMHLTKSEAFGYDTDNYIGSLAQRNTQASNWAQFYANERLIPQLEMAFKRKLLSSADFIGLEHLEDRLNDYFDMVQPCLLHGDLWRGNFLIADNGSPYLIDPAVYFGHSEVDIAMSLLFGGFGQTFYNAYDEVIPRQKGFLQRVDLYQLYYLLVHLNLFGKAYYSQVTKILRSYF